MEMSKLSRTSDGAYKIIGRPRKNSFSAPSSSLYVAVCVLFGQKKFIEINKIFIFNEHCVLERYCTLIILRVFVNMAGENYSYIIRFLFNQSLKKVELRYNCISLVKKSLEEKAINLNNPKIIQIF